MVQGTAAIPEDGDTRLEASVVMSNGEITSPTSRSGRLRDLMDLEKEVVVGIAGQLGYTLSEAERQLILENGTRNLAAFLAYSRGLLAEDMGDYSAAAAHFGEAVRADPNFQAARDGFQANEAASTIQDATPGEITVNAWKPPPVQPDVRGGAPIPDVTASAISSTLGDIAATQSELASQLSDQTETTTRATGSTIAVNDPAELITQTTIGIIRIVFRLP